MAFGAYPYSAPPPARGYGSSSSFSRRGAGTYGRTSRRRGVWTAFVVLVVAFYGAVLYLFHQHGPSPSSPTLRGQQLDAVAPDDAQAAPTTPHVPLGSVDGVAVLGMHRSGTSMITGLLQRMGLDLGGPGTLLGAVRGENDKGFFERIQVINQNDQLMKEQGVNWSLGVFGFDHLEAVRAALSDKTGLFAEGMAALGFYNEPAHSPWAVKDPRLCITLKFWTAFWKTPPAVLIVYRHPLEVAKSLVRRKEFGLSRGLHLWMAYNRLAIENSRGLCRVVTSDAALVRDGWGEVKRIHDGLKACGVAIPREPTQADVESFIDPSLRHHQLTHDGECDPVAPVLWTSEAQGHEKERQETAYGHARRLYCAMQDGSAFLPGFEFEDVSDVPPP